MPETSPEDAARPTVRRLTAVTLGLIVYFGALWAAYTVLVEASRGDLGMHVFRSLGIVLPIGVIWGVRRRSPLSLYLLVRGSFGGALAAIAWIVLEVGGGHQGEAGFVWSVLVAAGAFPASLYVWWLATRPPMKAWVQPPHTEDGGKR